jgi:hypothetical protein
MYQGETISLRALAKKVDLRYDTLRQRALAGVTGEALVSTERLTKTGVTKEPITYNGETHTIKEWSEKSGIKLTTLRARYERGLRGEELFAAVQDKFFTQKP